MTVVSWHQLAVGRRRIFVRREKGQVVFRDFDLDSEWAAAKLVGTGPGELLLVARAIKEEVAAGHSLTQVLSEIASAGQINREWAKKLPRKWETRPLTAAHLAYLVASENRKMTTFVLPHEVAAFAGVPAWLQCELAEDPDQKVRAGLARNTALPEAARHRLLADSSLTVMTALSKRDDLTFEEALRIGSRLLREGGHRSRTHVTWMKPLPAELARQAAADQEFDVRNSLGGRVDVPDDVLDQLYERDGQSSYSSIGRRVTWASGMWRRVLRASEGGEMLFDDAGRLLMAIADGKSWELRRTAPEGMTLEQAIEQCERALRARVEQARAALAGQPLESAWLDRDY